jgi:uncharacterized protein YlaI
MILRRNCPTCDSEIVHKSKRGLKIGLTKGTRCRSCVNRHRLSNPTTKPSSVQEIAYLHGLGKLNREISGATSISQPTVARILRQLGLITNGPRRGLSLVRTEAGNVRCVICRGEFPIDNLATRTKNGRAYKIPRCEECKDLTDKSRIEYSATSFVARRLITIKARSKATNTPFGIDTPYVMSLYDNQKGQCFYTDKVLRTRLGHGYDRESLSLDRVIPNIGYEKGNLVLCTRKANMVKNDLSLEEVREYLPGWFRRLEIAGLI